MSYPRYSAVTVYAPFMRSVGSVVSATPSSRYTVSDQEPARNVTWPPVSKVSSASTRAVTVAAAPWSIVESTVSSVEAWATLLFGTPRMWFHSRSVIGDHRSVAGARRRRRSSS